jgi:hypothetical protein
MARRASPAKPTGRRRARRSVPLRFSRSRRRRRLSPAGATAFSRDASDSSEIYRRPLGTTSRRAGRDCLLRDEDSRPRVTPRPHSPTALCDVAAQRLRSSTRGRGCGGRRILGRRTAVPTARVGCERRTVVDAASALPSSLAWRETLGQNRSAWVLGISLAARTSARDALMAATAGSRRSPDSEPIWPWPAHRAGAGAAASEHASGSDGAVLLPCPQMQERYMALLHCMEAVAQIRREAGHAERWETSDRFAALPRRHPTQSRFFGPVSMGRPITN